jgi:hypothetical protein
MGYKRYKPVFITVNGKEIQMINSYGYYTAEYVKTSGKPYRYADRKENWYSKTQCKNMKKPVNKNEEPVGFSIAMHGYYALYERNAL